MASFFTRALDRLTPFNMPGEVQRRKKREEEQQVQQQRSRSSNSRAPLSVDIARPGQTIEQPRVTTPKAQRPENLFSDLNQSLMVGRPSQVVDVLKTADVEAAKLPEPGTVIQPPLAVKVAPQQQVRMPNGRTLPVNRSAATAAPDIEKPKQSFVNRLRDVVDANTESDKYRRARKEMEIRNKELLDAGFSKETARNTALKVAKSNMDAPTESTIQSNATRLFRGQGSVASNFAGGLIGVAKGAVQLPSAILSAPKLVRLGAAKLTGNQLAEENIANDRGNLSELARKYEELVSPVTNPLTEAELATDRAATSLAPWAPSYVKPITKATANLIPVEAAAAGLTNLSRARNAQKLMQEGETAAGTIGTAGSGSRVVQIPVSRSIDVAEEAGGALDIPVRNLDDAQPLIQEVGGDATRPAPTKTPAQVAEEQQLDRFNNQDFGRPDDRIEGVTPTNTTNTGLFTRAEIDAERKALDDALAAREIDEVTYKAATEQLSTLRAVDDPPSGQKITIKAPDTIPVRDETIAPIGLPETPGTVRATTQASPNNAKSAQIAVQTPPSLPREVQEVLDNPKQFNKRQVAAARNQRKMARQMAKTQEQTAEAMERINTVSPAAASGEGFTPTGEFARSQNGGTYQKASRQAEMQQAVNETANMSPGDVLQTARTNQGQTGGFNRRDIRNISALFETKRIQRGTPEWQEARQILKEDGTIWGQQGALRNYTMRRTASADELVSRYESKIYRLADDPSKIDSKMFDEIEAAETAYTQARDDALAAYNRFTEDPTSANAKQYHAAQDAAEKADKAAKITEYQVANKALKGNKDVKQMRELEKMADEADLYQMDAVDASMLSGTGTFIRNFVNSAVGGVEESLFGGLASRASKLLTRQNVGGGIGRGSAKGFGEGAGNLVNASKARASNAGWNPLQHAKNWATTGNQLGDTIIDSQTKHNVADHYRQALKEEGYRGRELTDRASVMARQDPDNLSKTYSTAARVAAGLGAGVTRGNKIETFVKNIISDTISGGNPNKYTEAAAKLVTRMTIGFPTAIGRSGVEGIKRFTLGTPTFIKAAATKDPQARALLIKEGIKQAGTGAAVIPPVFYAMGASGLITGAYPKEDKEERARWEREGITENSVKINGAYYQLPAYLGSWAIPGLFYASLGRNGGDWSAAAADTAKVVPNLLPTDQMTNVTDVINGRSDLGKFMVQTGASAVRAATPAGALLNQIAKSFDDTKNDTNSGTLMENFVDKVLSGIPGINNMAGIPDKVDDSGNPIQNPNPLQLLMGAASAVQGEGEKQSAKIASAVDTTIQGLDDLGVMKDPNLKEILDKDSKAIYDKITSGKEVGEADVKKLQEAFVKGVSSEGTDTAYLEREQYDTNLAVLKLKRQLMQGDKTVRPSSVKDIDTAIKRGEVYKENNVPYDLITEYKEVGVDEWRKMGYPPEHDKHDPDTYDPDMFQKLWEIDDMLTKKGVSYKKGAMDKNKYFQTVSKAKGTGKGGRSGATAASTLSSDFGTLKRGAFAPEVQAYQSIDQKSGSVPIIRTVRPNIVHKITSSR